MSFASLVLVSVCVVAVVYGQATPAFSPFGASYGDTLAPASDDGYFGPVSFNFNFYGTEESSLFVDNNGIITFGNGLSDFTPVGMSGANFPAIAPYWADVYTYCGGQVWYGARTDADTLATLGAGLSFTPTRAFVVTWNEVGYFATCDKFDSFQAVLIADNNGNSQVCFHYGVMQWTTGSASGGNDGLGGTPASVGFAAGDGRRYVQTATSLTAAVLLTRDFCASVNTGTIVLPPAPPAQTCGNGIVEGSEQCDGGSCCSTTCTFLTAATTCRASVSTCDHAETCTGSSSTCPADTFASSSTVCRASAGPCDVAETCTGASSSCPADSFASSSLTCGTQTGPCDVASQCSGSAASCPTNPFVSSSTVCRASAGPCDVAETCTGASSACPVDSFASSSLTCGTQTGPCDVASQCSGSAASCPTNPFVSSSTVCRASAGPCDVAETCTGASSSCPADSFASSSLTCGTQTGPCDVASQCSGSAASCPTNPFVSSSTVCRASAGPCDIAETCTGSSSACPADSFQSSSTVCGTSSGTCDVASQCTGSTPSCPANSAASSSVVCRPAVNSCDIPESCTGSSHTCPADQLSMTPSCFCGRQTFVGGEYAINYFCVPGQAAFFECLQGPWAVLSTTMNCAAGTSCGCFNGQECSCGGEVTPCVTAGTTQVCPAGAHY